MRRQKRIKLSLKRVWLIQKELTGVTDKVMSFISLANIAAEKMGWPKISNSQSGYRELAKHYLIEYAKSRDIGKANSKQ